MKKILSFLVMCIVCVCAYANTCEYNGVKLTLDETTVTTRGGTRYKSPEVHVRMTSDKPASGLRVGLRFYKGNQIVKEVWVNLKQTGGYNFYCTVEIPEGTYTVQLFN